MSRRLALLRGTVVQAPAGPPTLAPILLTPATIPEGTAAATTVGTLSGQTSGSTLSLVDSAGGRFALSGSTIQTGATATDFETAATHNITIRETLAGATNSPRDTVIAIAVSDVAEAAGKVDTTDWNITLNFDGGDSGTNADIIHHDVLLAGYENEALGFTNRDGKLTFSPTVEGATTSTNTDYTRHELREWNVAGNTEAIWHTNGTGRELTSPWIEVLEVPTIVVGNTSRLVVVGQIHGENDELNRLNFTITDGITVNDDKYATGDNTNYAQATFPVVPSGVIGVGPGIRWRYWIRAKGREHVVKVWKEGTADPWTATMNISTFWADNDCYLKAGAYNQVARMDHPDATRKGTGRSTIVAHGPYVINKNPT